MSDYSQTPSNPFEAPQSDISEVSQEFPPGERGRMPMSVIVALLAAGLFVVLAGLGTVGNIISGQRVTFSLFSFLVGFIVLIGIYKGHRLAYQWGRILVALVAVLYTLGVVMAIVLMSNPANMDMEGMPVDASAIRTAMLVGAVVAGVLVAALWTIFFALGRPSARRYFRLVCPKCGHKKVRAVDFFFNKAKCKQCATVW